MARNSERDVELVIRARDEAERALSKITDALLGMSKAQQTVTGTAKGADGAIASLTKEVADLEARLKGLGDMSALVRGLDKSATAVGNLEAEVAQTVADLERLKQESAAAGSAVAQAEQKKAAATKGTKEERTAANRALREAQRAERTLAAQMERQNTLLQARIDRLERAKAAYDQLQQSANRAGAAMGVSPTRESVQSATASTQRQISDAQGLADFRAQQQANEQVRKRLEYERAWIGLLDDRDEQQRQINEAQREAARLQKESEAAFQREQARANQNNRADYERFWTQALEEREAAQRATTQAVNQAAAAEARLVQQAERLKGQLNPLGVAQDRYNQELREMEQMLERGLIDQKQFAAGQALITRRLNESKEALDRVNGQGTPDVEFMGLRPYELTNLSYQINDVITGLASGQPVVQILAQQGGQFVQIFGRQMQSVLPMLFRLGPLFLAAGAAATVFFGAMGRGMRQIENLRQFDGLLKATANSATFSAQQLAAVTEQIDRMGLKTDEARQIVRLFVREGINPANILPFTEAAKDLADVMGTEVPEAARRMAEGFTGGYEQIKQLDEEFQFLTAAEREQIKAMFESGRASEARRLAFDRFYKLMDDGAKAMKGPWEQAMSRLGRAWGNLLNAIANSGIIENVIKGLDSLGRKINEVSEGLESLAKRWETRGFVNGTMEAVIDNVFNMGAAQPGGAGLVTRGPAGRFQATEELVRRVIWQESRNGQFMRSPAGALGMMQVMPETGREVSSRLGERFSPERLLNDNEYNVRIGTAYLNQMLNMFNGDLQKALAAYNAGPGAVQRYGGIPPFRETQNYVQSILSTPAAGSRGPITSTTETQRARDQDYLANLQEQLAVTTDLTDQERVRLAGLKALREAQEGGLSDAAARRAQEMAIAAEQFKVDQERAARQRTLSDQVASDFREAGRQTDDLGRQREDIDRQTEARIERLNQARREGITEVNGVALADIEAQYRANGELLKQRAELEHRERELNALLDQRRTRLQALEEGYRIDLIEGDADPLAYMQAVNAVIDETSPKIKEAADALAAFVRSTGDTSERAQSAIARAGAAGGDDAIQRQRAAQLALNEAEKKYNDLLTARDAQLARIREQYYDNPETMTEESRRVIEETTPAIRAAAEEALRLAERLNAIKPTPELTAFIERARQATRSGSVATREVNSAESARVEGEINDLLAVRAAHIAVINEELERGKITRQEAEDRERRLYEGTARQLQELIEKRRELLDLMLREGQLTQAQYDREVAGLDQVALQTERVDQRTKALKEQLESAFNNSAMNAFDTFSRGLAEGKTAIESLGDAFRQFASEFLTQIARMIMQQIILNMLQSMGGMSIPGMGSGVQGMSKGGGIFGQLGGLIGKVGKTPTGIPIPTTVPVRHGGGMVGSGGQTRTVLPAIFANAMRHHAGAMIGLRPDEEAAILQTGEEVLSRADPRNRMNGGGSPVVNNKIINTIDPTEVLSAALGSKAGEQVLINVIRMNKRAVQGALG